MKTDEEIAEFITQNPLAWRIWMSGYKAGLAHGHQDERATTDQLADLTARRIMTLQDCEDHNRKKHQKHHRHGRGNQSPGEHHRRHLSRRTHPMGLTKKLHITISHDEADSYYQHAQARQDYLLKEADTEQFARWCQLRNQTDVHAALQKMGQ